MSNSKQIKKKTCLAYLKGSKNSSIAMVSYLVRQGQREEVKPIGVPLCNDLGQSLVVSHPANHLLLFEVVHGDWGAHWYRPVIQVTVWAMCSIRSGHQDRISNSLGNGSSNFEYPHGISSCSGLSFSTQACHSFSLSFT